MIGAVMVAVFPIPSSAALFFFFPDLPPENETRTARENEDADEHATAESTSEPATEAPTAPKDQGLRQLWEILQGHYRIFLTLGIGVMCLGALRASRSEERRVGKECILR